MENFERTEDGKGVVLPDVDLERYPEPTTAYGAKVDLDEEGKVLSVKLPKERTLMFDKPGRRLETKRLVTIKAHHPNGSIQQLPLEGQINNQIASPSDFVGLRGHLRKGYVVFFDFDRGVPAFCKTWGCYAEAQIETGGFCTPEHKNVTAPEEEAGQFGAASTGSDSYRRL